MLNIFAVIVGIFIFFFAMLLMPVKYILDVKISEDMRIHFHVSYLFGLVKFKYESGKKNKFRLLGFNVLKKSAPKMSSQTDLKNMVEEKIYQLHKKKSRGENIFKYEDIEPILSPTLEFVRAVIKRVRPKKIIIDGEIGFDDPAHTGYFCALEKFFCLPLRIRPNIKYNFSEKIFDLHFLFRGHSSALLFILIVIRYIRDEHVFSFINSNFISREVCSK